MEQRDWVVAEGESVPSSEMPAQFDGYDPE